MQEYQVCTRCVMDNVSDETITFDSNGYCNYCSIAFSQIGKVYFPNAEGEKRLNELIEKIKKENKNKQYDCIMGISGGLDSSYLAYLGSIKWGLRILAVHVDDGYDEEVTKRNLKRLCEATNIKMITIRPDAKQFNELTRAYLLAGVPNLAVPQDHILSACIYKFTKKNGIRTVLSGGNFALECILQQGNTYSTNDLRNIKDINKKYGRDKLNKLPLLSDFQRDIYSYIYKIEMPRPLNFINYNRDRALKELHDFCGFEYYGSKHLENKLTKFIQTYWFYHKFNVDKRKSHLSSMIVSGQMTRDKALEILKEPVYNIESMQEDIKFILKNLDLTEDEFKCIMNAPIKQHTVYKTSIYVKMRRVLVRLLRFILNKKNIF